MTIEIRRTTPAEYRTVSAALITSLLGSPLDDAGWERSRPSWEEMVSFSAWDGDDCVGHAGDFDVETTVPGGARVRTGAVSRVGVLPTHTRRGAATGLMERLIAESHGRGNALMSLRASEAVIYRRFGFGVGGSYRQVHITARTARPVNGVADGSFRLVPAGDIIGLVPELYERVAHRRAGIVTRPPSWWARYLRPAIEQQDGSAIALHVDETGLPDGYVHYDVKFTDGMTAGATGEGTVRDLFGASDAVELALWNYLFDIDLILTWRAGERPTDDLIQHAMHDPRSYGLLSVEDEQWIRLTDVDAALSARSFNPARGSVAIEVNDPLLPHNNRTWRIDGEGASATEQAPDLTVGIDVLSAAYLGGTSWHLLAGSGQVGVNDEASIGVADLLFASRPQPFCGSFF